VPLNKRALFIRQTAAAAGVALLVLTVAENALAQSDPAAPQTSDLEAVERDLERERQAQQDAQRRAEQSAKEAANIQARLIAAARRIQDREQQLNQLESELTSLEQKMERLSADLADKDVQMRDVLLALERLAVRPTDALMLQPLKPADAVRSGLVLSAAVPALTETAEQLRVDLDTLYRTRTDIIERRSAIAATAAELLTERAALESVLAEKSSQQEKYSREAAAAAARVQALAKEADDLRDLLEKVVAERARQAREAEEEKRKTLELTPPDGKAPSPEIVTARRPAPPEPERSFSQARGSLPIPAIGRTTRRYGEADADGMLSKGIEIATRPEAPVISPFDGVVAFAGPFRGYGLLLILEHSEGYHTLLAGMSRLDGAVGQRVLAGEPVGVMAPEGDPTLYVELRRNGQPINPLPWLAARTNETNG
jgi:septal ring factor EnvC (AmiA/AmiB activator)